MRDTVLPAVPRTLGKRPTPLCCRAKSAWRMRSSAMRRSALPACASFTRRSSSAEPKDFHHSVLRRADSTAGTAATQLAGRLTWETADAIWRWAGDTATDENHYSKRVILSGILVSTLAVDMASGRTSALSHLDARIDNVMAFEKWKAGLKPMDLATEMVEGLAKMRYGAR